MMNKNQKAEMLNVLVNEKGKTYKKAGIVDYVGAWYYKSAKFIQETNIKCALVSTNSIF